MEEIAALIEKHLDKLSDAETPLGLAIGLNDLCKEVAAAEREECAKLVEASIIGGRAWTPGQADHDEAANHIAKAIRERDDV